MKWLELHLDTQPAGIEPATELLSEYGIDSLMIDEEGDFKDFLENNHQYWDYVDDELMEQMHGKSRITFYLEDSAEGYNTLAQFRIGLSAFKKQHPEYAPLILSMENVEDADWENNWKQFYKPMEIGERLLVVPEWEQAQEDGRVKLVLNPGLTFGTGSHATTRLCLQALEQHIHGGEKVLDLGCGSGILSIAALLLGAMLTDTVIMKSPTTTDFDRDIIARTAAAVGVDPVEYGMSIFKCRSNPAELPVDKLVNADAKEFELSNGNKVYIGQYETVDLQAVLGREAEIREAIKGLVADKGYQFVLFFATDILAEGSQFICEGDTDFVNRAFDIDCTGKSVWMPGVLSRKKQVAAPILAL